MPRRAQQLPTGEIPPLDERHGGRVRWFSPEKGYGFIEPDHGSEDVFVRYSAIDGDGFRELHEGQRVTFLPSDDGRGPRALDVRATDLHDPES